MGGIFLTLCHTHWRTAGQSSVLVKTRLLLSEDPPTTCQRDLEGHVCLASFFGAALRYTTTDKLESEIHHDRSRCGANQVVRWGWNANGWASPWSDTRDDLLFGCGAIDFAGSGVVRKLRESVQQSVCVGGMWCCTAREFGGGNVRLIEPSFCVFRESRGGCVPVVVIGFG